MKNNKTVKYLYFTACIVLIYIIIRYALSWLMPFIAALCISSIAEPLVRLMIKKLRLPRTLASCIAVFLTFAFIFTILTLLGGKIIVELVALAREAPQAAAGAVEKIREIEARARFYISTAPEDLRPYLESAITGILERGAEFALDISSRILTWLSGTAAAAPRALFFVFTSLVATFFISIEYKNLPVFLIKQIPAMHRETLRAIKADMKSVFGKWLTAELILCLITFAVLTIVFLIMRIDFALVLAFIIALIDLLPVIGAGTVLAPWCIIEFIIGNSKDGMILFVGILSIIIIRNALEPKLVGRSFGIRPLATLIAMYVGYISAGFLGMIIAPMLLVVMKRINDRGVIRLWK